MEKALIFGFILLTMLLAGCSQQASQAPEASTPVQGSDQAAAPQSTPTAPDVTATPASNVTISPAEPPAPPSSGITVAELATHNTASDCLVAFKGTVFNVTKFLPLHPGGSAAIEKYCGSSTAFEDAFTRKHGTSKVSNLEQMPSKGSLA